MWTLASTSPVGLHWPVIIPFIIIIILVIVFRARIKHPGYPVNDGWDEVVCVGLLTCRCSIRPQVYIIVKMRNHTNSLPSLRTTAHSTKGCPSFHLIYLPQPVSPTTPVDMLPSYFILSLTVFGLIPFGFSMAGLARMVITHLLMNSTRCMPLWMWL